MCLRCLRSDVDCAGYNQPIIHLFDTFEHKTSNDAFGLDKPVPTAASVESICTDAHLTLPAQNKDERRPDLHTLSAIEPTTHHDFISDSSLPLTSSSKRVCRGSRAKHSIHSKVVSLRESATNDEHERIHNVCDRRSRIKRRPITAWTAEPNTVHTGLNLWNCSSEEMSGLEFFFVRTKVWLGTCNEALDRFLEASVKHMLHQEPTVRCQVIALGLFHRCRSMCSGISQSLLATAMQSYGTALRQLSITAKSSAYVILTSCLLFVAIDMLREGPMPAFAHLKKGIGILEGQTNQQYSATKVQCYIDDYIRPVFKSLTATFSKPDNSGRVPASQSVLNGCGVASRMIDTQQTPISGEEVQARRQPAQLSRHSVQKSNNRQVWRVWHQNFVRMWDSMLESPERTERDAKMIDAHHKMSSIATHCQDDEMSWDAYVQDHSSQVKICTDILRMSDDHHSMNSNFQDSGLIPGVFAPLFQVALTCRDLVIRRNAIELLRLHHHQLGYDDTCLGVVAAELVMTLEGANLSHEYTCSNVPLHQRVKLVEAGIFSTSFLACIISKWPFMVVEQILVPIDRRGNKNSLLPCSCDSFQIL